MIDVVVAADSLKARNIHLYLNGDTARIYCCSDSLQTLIHLFFAVKEEVAGNGLQLVADWKEL